MPTEWSESIVVADLGDEPAFSEELTGVLSDIERGTAGDDGASAPDVVIDLGQVTYLNSSNIAHLLRLRKHLMEHGGRLRISSVQEQVWSVMLVTGLDKVFEFTADKATALASLQLDRAGG